MPANLRFRFARDVASTGERVKNLSILGVSLLLGVLKDEGGRCGELFEERCQETSGPARQLILQDMFQVAL